MDKKIFVVTGLGYGDEGKGKTVHWLCDRHKAHTAIRTGGPQAYHRVVTSDGREHIHSHFGSGTLAGAGTHLSRNMLVDPYAILNEGGALVNELGARDLFEKLTIHEDALVITPFQAIANRLRELARGKSRYGSVGIGVGETVLDAGVLRDDAIRVKDLSKAWLRDKLEAVRAKKILDLQEIIGDIENFPQENRDRARLEITNLTADHTMEWALGWFDNLTQMAKIVDTGYVAKEILGRDGTVVFEGSQGVLLDRLYGFHPYTTKVRTVPSTAMEIINESNYDGRVRSLGILRAYYTRHGGGPFVTESSYLTRELPDAGNGDHPWQGNFRVGHFDAVATRYAIDACGGPNEFDGLVINCLDRISKLKRWDICIGYTIPKEKDEDNLRNFFRYSARNSGIIHRIKVNRGKTIDDQIVHQEQLGKFLANCLPYSNSLDRGSENNIVRACSTYLGIIEGHLGMPVIYSSFGPTEKDTFEV